MTLLKTMIENIINENDDNARVNFHSFVTAKMKNLTEQQNGTSWNDEKINAFDENLKEKASELDLDDAELIHVDYDAGSDLYKAIYKNFETNKVSELFDIKLDDGASYGVGIKEFEYGRKYAKTLTYDESVYDDSKP